MLLQPVVGATYLLRGFKLLTEPGLRRFVLLPLAINFLLFAALIWFGAGQFRGLIDGLMSYLPSWLAWLDWLFWVLFALVAGAMVFFTFTLVANLIGAPFNGLLAEAVERHLTGKAPPGAERVGEMLRAIPAILFDELKKILYFIAWAIPLLLLFLIPLVNLAAPLFWALFSAWMLAVNYSDFPMGNHGLKGAQMRARLKQRRMLALGFGGATLGATLIPVINFVVMPAAVAGATAMWVERLREERVE